MIPLPFWFHIIYEYDITFDDLLQGERASRMRQEEGKTASAVAKIAKTLYFS